MLIAYQNVVLNVWCLGCAIFGTYLASVWGRKPTALLSQSLLITCLFIIGGLSKKYADNPDGASKGLVYGDVAVMFLFQGFYSIGWTPLLTLYPPEVLNYSIRANGVAGQNFVLNGFAYVPFSPIPKTIANLNSLVFVYIMPIGLKNIGWKMYMVNASWDIIFLGLIVCFLLPFFPALIANDKQAYYWVETKGKTLEEIDALFEGEKHSDVPDVEDIRKGLNRVNVKSVDPEKS